MVRLSGLAFLSCRSCLDPFMGAVRPYAAAISVGYGEYRHSNWIRHSLTLPRTRSMASQQAHTRGRNSQAGTAGSQFTLLTYLSFFSFLNSGTQHIPEALCLTGAPRLIELHRWTAAVYSACFIETLASFIGYPIIYLFSKSVRTPGPSPVCAFWVFAQD